MNPFYFVHPWYALGLITLAIPILLLLTKAESLHITSFSSILFLRSVTEKASHVIEWKRLLLLASRLAILTALVLAFALPFVNRQGSWFGRPKTHKIFLLDNSYSMGYTEDGKSLFENAKERIAGLVEESHKGKTWLSLYGFNAAIEPWLLKNPDENRFQAALKEAALSSKKTLSASLFTRMKNEIALEPGIKTEVFIVSDFAMRESQGGENFEELVSSWCGGACETHLVAVQPKNFQNLGLTKWLLPFRFFLPGVEEEIKVAYQAAGLKDQKISVNLWVGGEKVDTKTIVPGAEPKGTVSFRHTFSDPGYFPVKAEVQADGLPADNVLYGVLPVQTPLRVLLIEPHEYTYPFENPYFYMTQVLQSSQSANEKKSWIQLTSVTLADLKNTKLENFHWILLADAPGVDARSLSQLRYHLKDGGAVLFSMGHDYENAEDLNSNALDQFLGGMLRGPVAAKSASEPFRLSEIDYKNPLFKIFGGGAKGDLKTVAFDKVMEFTPQEGAPYRVLASFEGRRPALIEVPHGKGRLFIWTSSFHRDWSDFPKNPLYVPFFFELMKYGAMTHQEAVQNRAPGEALNFDETPASGVKPLKVKNPAGEEVTLYRDNSGKLQSYLAETPGFYEWVDFQKEPAKKKWGIVNLDPEEGRPHYRVLRQTEFIQKEEGKKAGSSMAVKEFYYRPFLYLILVLLFVEAWLANQFYKPSLV